ncbi:hypothetical protein [Roseateles sp. PN1]|uniref:hypothetical protein n=1 Tax=Roseateles sp. PN1 TaxID=3137372 RepID=UPI0031396325
MNILLTLDYELFFGSRTGSLNASIIEPTNAILKIAQKKRLPLVFFVDIAYIAALRREMHKDASLRADHDLICRHIETLALQGHEIQLHIHSHWEDCHWEHGGWVMNTKRYKLHDFDTQTIEQLVLGYVRLLKELAGDEHGFAYRAGGWVIQPFEKIRSALLAANVRVDSTVFPGGTAEDAAHYFDFRAAPRFGNWRFDTDPCRPDEAGSFLEVPIASITVPPSFYWRFALHKKFGSASQKPFGDGRAIGPGRADTFKKLLTRTSTVVSMDGYKSSLLERAYKQYSKAEASEFCVIGHPKALSPYSLDMLDRFLTPSRAAQVVGYRHYL